NMGRHHPLVKRTLRERLRALENVPRLLKMVWDTSPFLTAAMVLIALLRGLMPLAALYIGKLIVDTVVHSVRTGQPPSSRLWWLVPMASGLALFWDLLARAAYLSYNLLARFPNRVSVVLIPPAATPDLPDLEDPLFYDKLERARRQTTSRQDMIKDLVLYARD